MRLILRPQLIPRDDGLHNLRHDGRSLANPVENILWKEDLVQVLLCADCWQPGCIDGNYVELRACARYVVWVPSPLLLEHEQPWQIAPPVRFGELGHPVWPRAIWDSLAERIGWPRAAELRPLTWDAARLLMEEESALDDADWPFDQLMELTDELRFIPAGGGAPTAA